MLTLFLDEILKLSTNGDTIRYDRLFAQENWQGSCQFNLAQKLKKTKNVLNGTKRKVKNNKKSELMLMRRETASV